ncbi:response regulator [Nocardioides marmoribigeumensis]|uniref:CheY-like chemotaxis protein n=1 Tax=Nocardioides marmoribigeumensis TaxID=433649 RepID=A0ABU2BWK0_9ACTN|nr:response regulator [Nocardioides marmoribigeumensis]MDR7362233.1 CheY-like chemotaxis protein [Nocardioides marmoribigeumensis]
MKVRTAVGTHEPGTVVVAEDDVDIRDLVQLVLEGLDLDVVAVGNGADALEACREHRPRLLLLDVTMPVMDGLETCRRVRADPELKDLRVILMTGRALRRDFEAGMDAGADSYIVKPFGPIELRELLEH